MKHINYYIFVLIIFTLNACTDVIDVDVPEALPRLVVEASIDWEKGTLGNEQTISLSLSTPYFDDSTTLVTGASVVIKNSSNNAEFVFADMNDGNYTTSNFQPVINQVYTLEIIYNGETYLAEEVLTPVVDIAELKQARVGGFDDEALEVDILFDDPINEENFYLFKFQEEGDLLPELLAIPDEFADGNRMKVFYEKEEDEDINQDEFMPGDVAYIDFYGISEQYYNYINLLIDQYENAENPFGTIPANLKGNCTNSSNPDNYAFGYFRLTQVVKARYTFQ